MSYREPAEREPPAPVQRVPLLNYEDKRLALGVIGWTLYAWATLVFLLATVVVGNIVFQSVDRGREHVIRALPKVVR